MTGNTDINLDDTLNIDQQRVQTSETVCNSLKNSLLKIDEQHQLGFSPGRQIETKMRVSPRSIQRSDELETSSFGTGPNTARGAIGS